MQNNATRKQIDINVTTKTDLSTTQQKILKY